MANRPTGRRARRRVRPRRALAAPAAPIDVALRAACADLAALDVRYALVGGLAVSARADPRLTRDVDVVVATTSDAEAEEIVHDFASRGYRVRIVLERRKTGQLATVRLGSPRSDIIVDLLFAACGIEREIVAAAQVLEILPGLKVPVARVGHLIAMKLLARDDRNRPQDVDDILALAANLGAAERRRIAVALDAIERRGFARRRDLHRMWATLAGTRGGQSLRPRKTRR